MHVVRRFIFTLCSLVLLLLFYRIQSSSYLSPDSTSKAVPEPDQQQQPQQPLNMGSTLPRIRLAIIEADTPVPNANKQYGGYGGVFKSLLTKALDTSDPPQKLEDVFDISVFHVVENEANYPNLDDVDGILISGSKHDAFGNDPWVVRLTEFTKQAYDTNRVKIVGVCFGQQILGRALDAKVGRSDKGWEIAVTKIDCTEEGKKIFGRDALDIQQMHHDVVFEAPRGGVVLARNAKCDVHAMYEANRYIAIQGHPEFTGDIVNEVIELRGIPLFGEEIYKGGLEHSYDDHDGVLVARSFVRFLHQG